jgi:hypothetical protein
VYRNGNQPQSTRKEEQSVHRFGLRGRLITLYAFDPLFEAVDAGWTYCWILHLNIPLGFEVRDY